FRSRRAAVAVVIGGMSLVAAALGGWMLRQPAPLPDPIASGSSPAPHAAPSPASTAPPPSASPARSVSPSLLPGPAATRRAVDDGAALFTASCAGDLVTVANVSHLAVNDVRITLVGPSGERYTASESGTLAA